MSLVYTWCNVEADQIWVLNCTTLFYSYVHVFVRWSSWQSSWIYHFPELWLNGIIDQSNLIKNPWNISGLIKTSMLTLKQALKWLRDMAVVWKARSHLIRHVEKIFIAHSWNMFKFYVRTAIPPHTIHSGCSLFIPVVFFDSLWRLRYMYRFRQWRRPRMYLVCYWAVLECYSHPCQVWQ